MRIKKVMKDILFASQFSLVLSPQLFSLTGSVDFSTNRGSSS